MKLITEQIRLDNTYRNLLSIKVDVSAYFSSPLNIWHCITFFNLNVFKK